jgi:REP element-mobilizing transposase RayT
VTCYFRHLPHWRQDGATYFVTFRLADSLPQAKLEELKRLKVEWERKQGVLLMARESRPTKELVRRPQERVECWLDQGMGSCVMRDPALAAELIAAMKHFDGERYELGCYVVMPNHAHVVVRPFHPETTSLEEIVGCWKKFSARRINARLGVAATLWQEETYDRIIRDEEHLWRVIQYIGANPAKAGLATDTCPLWLRPQWLELGWRFGSHST